MKTNLFLKSRLIVRLYSIIFGIAIFLAMLGCSGDADKRDGVPLVASLDDLGITAEEYVQRTETNTLPQFKVDSQAKLNDVLLNNLITEKIFALEESRDSSLLGSKAFKGHIKGIKEQLMREALFYERAHSQVVLDDAEVARFSEAAQKSYTVALYGITSDSLAMVVNAALSQKNDFKERAKVFNELANFEKPSQKTISFFGNEPAEIRQALFEKTLEPETVVGPIKINTGGYFLLKIISQAKATARLSTEAGKDEQAVREVLIRDRARTLAQQYIADIVHGRQIRFNQPVFLALADIYFQNINTSQVSAISGQKPGDALEIGDSLMQARFITVDENPWSVADFKTALLSHPLKYTSRIESRESFYPQFRKAVVELVRDHFLTEAAYKDGLDKKPSVRRQTVMWKNAYLALYHRNQFLKNRVDGDNDNRQAALKDYVRSLQEKYGSQIKLHDRQLNTLAPYRAQLKHLKATTMYPIVAPVFPQLDEDGDLSYIDGIE